jgi:hypothetical protein
MEYRSEADRYMQEIEAVRVAVAKAQEAYSKDGVDGLNRAQRELADAHDRFRECSGNRVPDKRSPWAPRERESGLPPNQ